MIPPGHISAIEINEYYLRLMLATSFQYKRLHVRHKRSWLITPQRNGIGPSASFWTGKRLGK
jgi:hypothetical protein